MSNFEDVEPNVFYEPRVAAAPFAVLKCYRGVDSSMIYWDGPHKTRAAAEEAARRCANEDETAGTYYVVGCLSITTRPTPPEATTRSLV